MTKSGTGLSRIDGPALKAMLAAAADWISQNAGAIDAINVFPVPDGDTGSNMSATLRSAADAAAGADGGAASVLAAAAKGALLGARGNSGVILSQILDGLAAGAGQAETLDGRALARCLLQADTAARLSVTEPKEGTILTVLTDAAAAAEEATANSSSVVEVLEAGTLAARASVARTPELLPILRQAGVVDSGGLGLSIILDGCLAKISNTSSAVLRVPVELENRANQQSLSVVCDVPAGNSSLGYCTEFIIEGESLRRDPLRDELRRLGDSVLVVGQERLLRVHLHTADPGAALSLGLRHGALSRIKVDNLEDQRRALGGEAAPSVAVGASVVAVAAGEGFGSLLAGYGAIVVDGGQTQNPSTAEILAAIDHAPGKAV
ncbi:MAG TPA: DAK2 domain-containing protein, partial [Dehalococcoidia bacterium]|nr:DAK2 domain-containing protein [Dehalococcoidia bacterium]